MMKIEDWLVDQGADRENVNVTEFDSEEIGRLGVRHAVKELFSKETLLLAIVGRDGRGKSTLALSIAKRYSSMAKTVSEVVYRAVDAFSSESGEIIPPDCKLLVLDNVERASDKTKTMVEEVICYRFAKELPTVVCANATGSEIDKVFTSKVLFRLNTENGNVLELYGRNRKPAPEHELLAFRAISMALLDSNCNCNFVTDEQIKADMEFASKEEITNVLIQVKNFLAKTGGNANGTSAGLR